MKARLYAIGCLSSILLILAFPPFGFWALAWVALIPLFWAVLEAEDAKEAANIAAVAAVLFTAVSLWWLFKVFSYMVIAFWFIFSLWIALHAALIWRFWHRPVFRCPERGRPWAWIVLAAMTWVGIEYFRSEVWWLYNSWAVLGYSQVPRLPMLQMCSLWGVYMSSGLIVAFNAAALVALKGKRAPLAVLSALLAALWLWGSWRVSHHPLGVGEPFQAAVVQDESYDLERLVGFSTEGKAKDAKLLVWPEYSTSVQPGSEDRYRQHLGRRLKDSSAVAVVGAAVFPDDPKDDKVRMQNFAWVLGPDGELLGRYDKLHPIPYVEHKLEGNPDPRPVDTPAGRLGVQICYDLDFEDGTRRMVKEGAQILVVPNLDPIEWTDWEHRQHSAMSPVRAVESGLWILRAASSGISQIIDPVGRVRASMKTGDSGVLVGEARLAGGGTVYSRCGWLLAPLCLAGTVLFMLFAFLKRR